MIIWGSRGITSTSGQGRFYCPSCDGERNYQAKRLRRFFTLYFIPIFPMGTISEWVECVACHGAFKPEVLKYDPRVQQQAIQAQIITEARRILAIAAGPSLSPAARTAMKEAHQALFDKEWPDAEMESLLARVDAHPSLESVRQVSEAMTANVKESILLHALKVARTADGNLALETVKTLGETAVAMGLTEAHWRGIQAS
jgi:hypothetical protein